MSAITQQEVNAANDKQSLALMRSLQNLSDSDLQAFAGERRKELLTLVQDEHSDTAIKHMGELARAQDNVNNIMYYYVRNQNLNELQGTLKDRAESEAKGAQHDSELAKRQFEINEWSAANKAETLFLMQLFLIAITFTIFLLFLTRMGVVPITVFYIVSSLIFIAWIFTFVIRYQYTTKSRSNRYWNRKNYASMAQINLKDTCPGAASGSSLLSQASSALDSLSSQGEALFGAFEAGISGIGEVGGRIADTYAENVRNTGSSTAPAPSTSQSSTATV